MTTRYWRFAATVLFLLLGGLTTSADAAQTWRFRLEEATIADIHRAIRAKQITATELVQLYFKRIEAYNGPCVKGDVDPKTGLQLGEITSVENAGQLNAYMTLNVRGKRSKTDGTDNDHADNNRDESDWTVATLVWLISLLR